MDLRKFFMGRAVSTIVLVCILGIVAGFYALNDYIYKEKQGDDKVIEPYRGTLTGTHVCLPHKDTSGPQTLECAIGIKTDAGEYYALDFYLMSQTHRPILNGERFTATGLITPIELLSTDHWQKYNVQGIFSVTDSVQVENDAKVPSFAWKFVPAISLNLDGNPETNIFLEAKYEDGTVQNKLIDTTPGSCNDLPDTEDDSLPNTTNIQCYSAGLGYKFKITKGESSYLVQRLTFEEGQPDYVPPLYLYEVIAEFPFSI